MRTRHDLATSSRETMRGARGRFLAAHPVLRTLARAAFRPREGQSCRLPSIFSGVFPGSVRGLDAASVGL